MATAVEEFAVPDGVLDTADKLWRRAGEDVCPFFRKVGFPRKSQDLRRRNLAAFDASVWTTTCTSIEEALANVETAKWVRLVFFQTRTSHEHSAV